MNVSVPTTLNYLEKGGYSDLALILVETWQDHPAKASIGENNRSYQMWKEQIALNLPVLFLASLRLHIFVQNRGIKHLLFATRDCIHWYRIYRALYPNDNAHYFHCSRNMFNGAREQYNKHYEAYVDKVTGNDIAHTVFIDVHGTGKRMYDYFLARKYAIPACFILSSGHSVPNNLPDGIKHLIAQRRAKFLVFKAAGSPIEMLNYDKIGSCYDYNQYGDVRGVLEYSIQDIEEYHKCTDNFIRNIKKHASVIIHNRDGDNLNRDIRYLFAPALNDLPCISEVIDPERQHDIGPKIE